MVLPAGSTLHSERELQTNCVTQFCSLQMNITNKLRLEFLGNPDTTRTERRITRDKQPVRLGRRKLSLVRGSQKLPADMKDENGASDATHARNYSHVNRDVEDDAAT